MECNEKRKLLFCDIDHKVRSDFAVFFQIQQINVFYLLDFSLKFNV